LKPALLFAPSEHRSPVVARQLREFIANRPHLVENKCNGEYVWPDEKPFQTHEPPAPVVIPHWMDWLINLSIAAVLGALGFAFCWLVVR
jgi:hypothetical protein